MSSKALTTTLPDRLEQDCTAAWNPHPRFAGVAMKTLISGKETAGQLSQHLVRVDPGCTLDWHEHPTQCESHLVISGDGEATLGERTADYAPGSLKSIAAGMQHRVRAGSNGLMLIASFSPALS